MSYTMTMDMPTKESAYIRRRGPRFQSQLRSLVIAFVTAEMQRDSFESWSGEKEFKAARLAEKSKLDFVADWGRFQVREDELNLSRTNDSLREVDFG